MNWRSYQKEFDLLTDRMIQNSGTGDLIFSALPGICSDDPLADETILGTPACLVAYLEYLFFRAEGPYSPSFSRIAPVIQRLFTYSESLINLVNLNGADVIGNMVLNKRGRLKFSVADHLELVLILEWWIRFGLNPVSSRDVFEAILKKSGIHERITRGDPVLILRLIEVFPGYRDEICPPGIRLSELEEKCAKITPLPSYRRYHSLYQQIITRNRDLLSVIREEENRILPVEVRRNHFLAYLVRRYYDEQCLICTLTKKATDEIITVHHIIPLSEQGKDGIENMLVVCKSHHDAIHAGKILVEKGEGSIRICCSEGEFVIPAII